MPDTAPLRTHPSTGVIVDERTEETTDDPARTGLPVPLPGEPADVPRLRRRRRVRLTAEVAVPSVVVATAVALLAVLARRRSRWRP